MIIAMQGHPRLGQSVPHLNVGEPHMKVRVGVAQSFPLPRKRRTACTPRRSAHDM